MALTLTAALVLSSVEPDEVEPDEVEAPVVVEAVVMPRLLQVSIRVWLLIRALTFSALLLSLAWNLEILSASPLNFSFCVHVTLVKAHNRLA